MAYFKVPSFLYIFILINYSLAVLNNSGNKNENVDIEKTLCVNGDIAHGNGEMSEPIVIATENVSSVKVKKVANTIEDRTSIISNEYELPLQSSNNQGPTFMPTKSFHSIDLQLPEVFPPQPQLLNSFPQFGNTINRKKLQFGAHYRPTFLPHRSNQIKSIKPYTIPTSLEAYGPPINKLVRPYFTSSSSPMLLQNEHHDPLPINQVQNNIHNDLLSNAGIFAPPSPPDIKYDGWKPIPGHISPPNHLSASEQVNEHTISSLSSNDNLIQLPGREVSHSPRQLSEFPTAIPSNSYGEPINNPEDHNLKQSVRQSQISDGLPPLLIPEQEPFHVNQGPTKMIFSTGAPPPANIIRDSHHQKGLELQQLPNIDNNLSGLFRSQSSNGKFKNHNTDFRAENDLSLQQLPLMNNRPFTTCLDSTSDFGSTYLAPPPSSYSSSGLYPTSRRPSYLVDPLRKPFRVTTNNGIQNIPKFMHQRNRGTLRSQSTFSTAPLISDFIPPRSSPHANFRQKLPLQLSSNSIHDTFPSSSTSLISSGSYDSIFGSNFIKDHQYSASFDSYGSSSSNQHEFTLFPNHSQLEGHINQSNEKDRDKSVDISKNKVNSDIELSTSDVFKNLHQEDDEIAQVLAETLASENVSSDSIQIQDSKDSYTLQIQPMDGRQEMENIDGSIKHDQILSEGLLHDIIMAIEKPENNANVRISSNSPVQSLEEVHEHLEVLPSPTPQYYSFRTGEIDNNEATSQFGEKLIRSPTSHDREEIELLLNGNNAALFFDNFYEKSINSEELSPSFRDKKVNRTDIN